jgi:hypothetical protein
VWTSIATLIIAATLAALYQLPLLWVIGVSLLTIWFFTVVGPGALLITGYFLIPFVSTKVQVTAGRIVYGSKVISCDVMAVSIDHGDPSRPKLVIRSSSGVQIRSIGVAQEIGIEQLNRLLQGKNS